MLHLFCLPFWQLVARRAQRVKVADENATAQGPILTKRAIPTFPPPGGAQRVPIANKVVPTAAGTQRAALGEVTVNHRKVLSQSEASAVLLMLSNRIPTYPASPRAKQSSAPDPPRLLLPLPSPSVYLNPSPPPHRLPTVLPLAFLVHQLPLVKPTRSMLKFLRLSWSRTNTMMISMSIWTSRSLWKSMELSSLM